MTQRQLPVVTVKRRDLQTLLDAAFNHVVSCKMVGMHSSSGDRLEQAALNIPCPYCGEVGMVHNEHCDREFWRGTPDYERLLRDFGRSNDSSHCG
jgi:predicted RNA-binding Zn-ribbon protein involved in translation (DUF1610 family)